MGKERSERERMTFKIPKQFELMGHTINVEWADDLVHTMDASGTAHLRENKVKLQKPTASWPVPKDSLEHTYFHELVHWILYMLKQEELCKDEMFVDTFAGLLYQSIKTAKGEMKY